MGKNFYIGMGKKGNHTTISRLAISEIDDDDLELYKNIDCDDVIAEMLLELRENHNITTPATCIMSEKFLALLKLDRKIFSSMIWKSLKDKSEIDPETLMILNAESPFSQSCLRFCSEKAL